MIKSHFFFSFLLLSAIGFTVSSCSNDDVGAPLQNGVYTVGLINKADVSICSGNKAIYSTLVNKAVANATLAGASVKSTVVDTVRVEVNLSVNSTKETGEDYIDTKLSIHVRDTTDVEVVIPTPYRDVVQFSLGNGDVQGTDEARDSIFVSYTVAGQPITLTVIYGTSCIRVKTSGINATVLKYLRTVYRDGITFDVWNYYMKYIANGGTTTSVTRESLKSNYLDCSTITFTKVPSCYVNAFATVNNYSGKIYGKKDETTGVWTPYTDSRCTTELPGEYWTRTEDAQNYILKTHKCEWDCTVTPPADYRLVGTEGYNNVYKK